MPSEQPNTPSDWTVTLSPGTDVQAAAQRLRSAGLQIEHVLAEIGVVTGRATPAQAQRLRGLPGVDDVSGTTGADVGPPDSDLS